MRRGRFIAVVGPSGVGKDSVIDALIAARPDLHRARRVITRPTSAGGEDFEGTDRADFMTRAEAGEFALWWDAHDLLYGIPAEVYDFLARGQDVIANLSRKHLVQADRVFDGILVLHITATPEILAKRLAARGRESAEEISKRLARQAPLSEGLSVVEIDNSGALEDSVAAGLNALYPVRV